MEMESSFQPFTSQTPATSILFLCCGMDKIVITTLSPSQMGSKSNSGYSLTNLVPIFIWVDQSRQSETFCSTKHSNLDNLDNLGNQGNLELILNHSIMSDELYHYATAISKVIYIKDHSNCKTENGHYHF